MGGIIQAPVSVSKDVWGKLIDTIEHKQQQATTVHGYIAYSECIKIIKAFEQNLIEDNIKEFSPSKEEIDKLREE